MNLTTRGQGSLSVIQFAFLSFLFFCFRTFYLRSWKRFVFFLSLPCDLIWRTVLRACHVETKVDQGGVWSLFFGEIFFPPLLWQDGRVEKRKSSAPASINLPTSSSLQTVLSSVHPRCGHITSPDPPAPLQYKWITVCQKKCTLHVVI